MLGLYDERLGWLRKEATGPGCAPGDPSCQPPITPTPPPPPVPPKTTQPPVKQGTGTCGPNQPGFLPTVKVAGLVSNVVKLIRPGGVAAATAAKGVAKQVPMAATRAGGVIGAGMRAAGNAVAVGAAAAKPVARNVATKARGAVASAKQSGEEALERIRDRMDNFREAGSMMSRSAADRMNIAQRQFKRSLGVKSIEDRALDDRLVSGLKAVAGR